MSSLAIVMLAFVIGIFLIMALSIWGMNQAAPRMIGAKHHALQAIVETRLVPQAWRTPFVRKAARLAKAGAPAESVAAVQQEARECYLQRLDGLIAYASQSTLVSDEETRQMLLDQLAAVRAEWQAKSVQEL